MDPEQSVILNVGGVRHETFPATLKRHPNTLLATLKPSDKYYRESRNEYFFDRHPGVFGAILNYYRTDELHCPLNVCGSLFEKELNFWGIHEENIMQCCWIKYNDDKSQKEFLNNFESTLLRSCHAGGSEGGGCCQSGLRKLWLCMEQPKSSTSATVSTQVSIFSLYMSIYRFILTILYRS